MEKKELIRELLNKVWIDDYPDDNEGINQCKMDLQTVEKYIEDLEEETELLITILHIYKRVFEQMGVERAVTNVEQVEKCEVNYFIDYHEDGTIEVIKEKDEVTDDAH